MRQYFLRYLNSPILLLITIMGLAFETAFSTVFPFNYFRPEISLILIIWCALHRGFLEGGIIALLLSEIVEINSGSPKGFFSITYMSMFLILKGTTRWALLSTDHSVMILSLLITLFWKVLSLLLMGLMGVEWRVLQHHLPDVFWVSLSTGILSFWAFRWLEDFDWVTFKNPKARKIIEDEMRINEGAY